MVGSTGTIRTMRLLRHKRTSESSITNTTTNTLAVDIHQHPTNATSGTNNNTTSTTCRVTMDLKPSCSVQRQHHNASITSNTSSRSSVSNTSSSASSSASSSYASTSRSSGGMSSSQRDHHHHQHHRSLSMRDQYLDLPWDEEAHGPMEYQPAIAYRQSPASVWVFPPLPPQPNLYCNNSQDALCQFEKAGLKGFRKQFSGRFKRFVLRKPAEPAPAIPPELKCQLKSIYVY